MTIDALADTQFTPSFDDQLKQMLGEPDASAIAGGIKSTIAAEVDPEDLEGLIELPFDTASIVTDYEGWTLSPKESQKLCKLFSKPFAKLAEKYGLSNVQLVLACTTLVSITAGKYVEYRMFLDNRSRNERKRQDEFNERGTEEHGTPVHS